MLLLNNFAGIAQLVERNLAKVEVRVRASFPAHFLAKWQSGNAAACKAVNAGSIPTLALCILEYKKLHYDTLLINNIVFTETARVAELVDARDLKSPRAISCRFDSGPGHYIA